MSDERWPETVDEILGGDQCVVLAHVTPARGVVLAPVTNFALRDRQAGTVSVNSSIGMWRKLQALQRNPRVALAFHTRTHGFSARTEYVLVQGDASLSSLSDSGRWLESLEESWERFSGQSHELGPLWGRWLRAYHRRVNIEIAVRRVIVWPELACRGIPEVYGAPQTERPASQRPPAKGTAPRVEHVRAARRAGRLADVLLGWVETDGYPTIAPVEVTGSDERGILLSAAAELVPSGCRRAGLLAHEFSRHVVGQHQRKHTGWLTVQTGQREGSAPEIRYAPHTEAGYRLPPSRLLFNLSAGYLTHRGLRAAQRAGFLEEPPRGVRTRELRAEGIRTRVLEMGPEQTSEAVVLLHGSPGCANDWNELLPRTGALARSIAFDLPGFGQAEKPGDWAYSPDSFAKFIASALDQLGVKRAHLVMSDLGGAAGVFWASTQPDALASAVMLNTGVLIDYRWHPIARLHRTPLLGTLVALCARPGLRAVMRLFNNAPRKVPAEVIDRWHRDYDWGSRRAMLRFYRATPTAAFERIAPALGELDRPALVLWGAHDRFLALAQAWRQRESFPSAEVIVLPDSGHYPHLDDLPGVARAVTAFLERQL